MARLNIELSNEDLESLRKGGRIEVEMIGNTPKIVISAEPEFDFKDNYEEAIFSPFYGGPELTARYNEPYISNKELNDLLEKVAPCTSDVKERYRKKRLTEWQKGWYCDK